MKEILFRAKELNTGEWVYGYYIYSKLIDQQYIFDEFLLAHYVDPDTVGQYTGLTDINGVKIFEGDVFAHRHVVTYVANYNDALGMNAGWYTQRDNFEGWCELACENYHEVLGNKWDNPELLDR